MATIGADTAAPLHPATPAAPRAVPDEAAWPSPRLAWTALFLLMAGVIVACLDRAIITMLVEPIKAAYGLTDTQFGALQGVAFGTLYVALAVPLGMLADRYQRRVVIGIGMTIFTLFSLGTGLARNFTQLFLCRMGVGFGEASINPAGFSIISDYFPPARLGRAISLFTMSSYIGASSAFIVGGAMIDWFTRLGVTNPAALHGFAPWQLTIICVALPGVVLAPCFFLLREPPRRGLVGGRRRIALPELMRELGRRRRFLVLMIAGMSMASTMTQAVSMWTPALFIRVYGWSATRAGFWIGTTMLVGAVLGSYLAGWMTDRLTKSGRLGGPITISAMSFVGVGIFGIAAPLMPNPALSLMCFLPVLFLKPMAFACAPMSLQMVIPNQLRAQVSAGYLTILNLVGLAFGPVVVGAMNDYLFTGPKDVRYSLALMTAITVPLMVSFMLLAQRPFRLLREEQAAAA